MPGIFFRVKTDRVEIARVLHDVMDLPRHTEELFRESEP